MKEEQQCIPENDGRNFGIHTDVNYFSIFLSISFCISVGFVSFRFVFH